MAFEVLKAACDRELRVATAESCTRGLLAALLTDIEGCSHAFERGFVCYADEAKIEMLGVDADLLARLGAVSHDVAEAMAAGALARSRADIALSITGYTDDSGEGEAGLVFFGLACRGLPVCVEERRFGDIGRGAARIACLSTGLMLTHRPLTESSVEGRRPLPQ
ncbi:CinA family protein [Roseomonas terrae]|uniref:CinA family protein n=1 Tax=Neoroseomonas terrae TaxID=424799 RepID=A0ABS5ECW6_9PROT|nr:nicotinamide-nucleotide amidohydrolase family protein [Neoroseomonas terrae]MBR0648855.1 CinA family protein [Neoroseomonas terrae]